MNAANEVAVEALLNRQIGFMDIAKVNQMTVEKMMPQAISGIDDVLAVDHMAREFAKQTILRF